MVTKRCKVRKAKVMVVQAGVVKTVEVEVKGERIRSVASLEKAIKSVLPGDMLFVQVLENREEYEVYAVSDEVFFEHAHKVEPESDNKEVEE